MKLISFFVPLFAFSATFSSVSFGAGKIPDWQGELLGKKNPYQLQSVVSKATAESIIQIAKDLYTPEADALGEDLSINLLWSKNEVNANASRFWGSATINIFGGIVRYQYATADFIASTLCHEIGHLYGGSPKFDDADLSAEGQSDYYIGKQCIFDVMSRYNATENPSQDPLVIQRCNQVYQTVDEDVNNPTQNVILCRRALEAAKVDGIMLAEGRKQPVPDMTTPPDSSVTNGTIVDYPDTVQCRFDTELAGMLGLERPKCWYADADVHDGSVPLINNKILLVKETFLKKTAATDTTLPPASKCALPVGSMINYTQRSLESGHYKINLSQAPANCPDFTGYLYVYMTYANEIYGK